MPVELERITTLKTKAPVRAVVPSPDGRWLLVILDGGATLYQRTAAGFAAACELPVGPTALVLDDGGVIDVQSDYREVELIRHGPTGAREARFVAMTGVSLHESWCALEPDGRHALVAAVDRDGQGWSQPIYRTGCTRIDLRTGALASAAPPPHQLLAPGTPVRVLHDAGGRAAELCAPEVALRLGSSRVLTSTRVIAIASGETLHRARGALFDLSADERIVLGVHDGQFELRDLDRASPIAQLDPKHEATCAAFLASGEVVAGTAGGRVLVLAAPPRLPD